MGRRYGALPFREMHSTLFLSYHCHFSSLNITFCLSFSLRTHEIFHLTRKKRMPPAIGNLTWHLVPSPSEWQCFNSLPPYGKLVWSGMLSRKGRKPTTETSWWTYICGNGLVRTTSLHLLISVLQYLLNVKRWKIFIVQQRKKKPTPPSFDRSRQTSITFG